MRTRNIRLLFVLVFLFLACYSRAQTIQILDSGIKTSIRGLSVVNDKILWASGSNGKVAKSTDGGKSFNWMAVAGYEQRDFRDVEAFDSNTAIIMAIAEPAVILKTKDGGKSWKKVFEDSAKGMFLDAMDFYDKHGFVIGDPINSKAFVAQTDDDGETWKRDYRPIRLDSGEAFFASSGTNLITLLDTNNYRYYFYAISGGKKSNFIINRGHYLPLIQGQESQGANSLDINSLDEIVIVGGDFKNDKDATANCTISNDFGKTWLHPQTPPHGYRSCVEFITDKQLITCGTSGVDISNDGGMNWNLISPESFHVCQRAKDGNTVFLAGKDGRIAKLIY